MRPFPDRPDSKSRGITWCDWCRVLETRSGAGEVALSALLPKLSRGFAFQNIPSPTKASSPDVPFKGRIDTSHRHLADVFIPFSSVAHSESHHIHSVENDSAGSYTDSNRESRNNHKLLLLEKCQVGLHGPFFRGRFG